MQPVGTGPLFGACATVEVLCLNSTASEVSASHFKLQEDGPTDEDYYGRPKHAMDNLLLAVLLVLNQSILVVSAVVTLEALATPLQPALLELVDLGFIL